MILEEEKMNEVRVIGRMDNTIDHTFESANRIYDRDGVCPTIPTCTGGGIQPKIVEERGTAGDVRIAAMRGRGERNEQRLEVGGAGCTNALTTVRKDNLLLENAAERYRIRKLTAKECWRLMGYTDEDFGRAAAVNSNTQLYRESGNAIVKQVLMAIFLQLNIQNKKNWNDMSVNERRSVCAK